MGIQTFKVRKEKILAIEGVDYDEIRRLVKLDKRNEDCICKCGCGRPIDAINPKNRKYRLMCADRINRLRLRFNKRGAGNG